MKLHASNLYASSVFFEAYEAKGPISHVAVPLRNNTLHAYVFICEIRDHAVVIGCMGAESHREVLHAHVEE